jgi:hypothetical protein
MLEAARQLFMEGIHYTDGALRNESFIAWVKQEIRKRGGEC